MSERRVFVSYSHDDEAWAGRLVEALVPWVRRGELDVWSDRRIGVGDDWSKAIDDELAAATVGVVLVSASLLSSPFVMDRELPALLTAAGAGRLTLVWFVVSAAAWEATDLEPFQAALDPREPLDTLSDGAAQAALVDVARKIAAARSLTDLARTLEIVDALSVSEGEGVHRVQAHHVGTHVQFDEIDADEPIATITYAELAALPDDDFALIESLQDSMRNEYERWRELRARRTTLTSRERAEFERAGRSMCGELRTILDFVEYTVHKSLQDHYGAIRYSCERLVAVDPGP